jgi:hypothetical protein
MGLEPLEPFERVEAQNAKIGKTEQRFAITCTDVSSTFPIPHSHGTDSSDFDSLSGQSDCSGVGGEQSFAKAGLAEAQRILEKVERIKQHRTLRFSYVGG